LLLPRACLGKRHEQLLNIFWVQPGLHCQRRSAYGTARYLADADELRL